MRFILAESQIEDGGWTCGVQVEPQRQSCTGLYAELWDGSHLPLVWALNASIELREVCVPDSR